MGTGIGQTKQTEKTKVPFDSVMTTKLLKICVKYLLHVAGLPKALDNRLLVWHNSETVTGYKLDHKHQ